MPRKANASPDSGGAPSGRRGSFDAGGAWRDFFAYESPTEHFVRILVRARLASRVAPATLALQIRAHAQRAAFPSANLRDWDALTSWNDWPLVVTRTSAEEMVKRCGRSTEGHWEGGEWITGDDQRQFVPVGADTIAEMVSALAITSDYTAREGENVVDADFVPLEPPDEPDNLFQEER